MKTSRGRKTPEVVLRRVLKRYPDLTYRGLSGVDRRLKIFSEERAASIRREHEAMLTPAALDQFERCCRWLEKQPRTTKVHPQSGNSYSLKEEVEQESGYVTSGMFIAAAIACGYQVAQAGSGCRHAYLNIGQLRPTNPNLHLLTSKKQPFAHYSPRGPRRGEPRRR